MRRTSSAAVAGMVAGRSAATPRAGTSLSRDAASSRNYANLGNPCSNSNSRVLFVRSALVTSSSAAVKRFLALKPCLGSLLSLNERSPHARRGWSALETPAGRYQVIRGPRPKSKEWPKAHQNFHGGVLRSGTSFRGAATQAIWASTAASSQTMAPWAVWHPTKSRRSCGQRTLASGAVASALDALGESESAIAKGLAAALQRSSSEAVGSPIRRVSSLHQALPEQVVPSGGRTRRRTRSCKFGTGGKDPPRDDSCSRGSHSCHHSERVRRPC